MASAFEDAGFDPSGAIGHLMGGDVPQHGRVDGTRIGA